jgi:hypothetical protein
MEDVGESLHSHLVSDCINGMGIEIVCEILFTVVRCVNNQNNLIKIQLLILSDSYFARNTRKIFLLRLFRCSLLVFFYISKILYES